MNKEATEIKLKATEAFFRNEKLELFELAPHIYKAKPTAGIEIDVEDGYEMRSVFSKRSKGNKFAVLIDTTNFFSTTSEFRKLLASKEFTDLRFATAIITQSMASRIIGNFFIKVNKPASPTKLFATEESAFKWLCNLALSLQ